MDCQVESNTSRRRSLRRAVRVETDVVSDFWEGSVPLLATDLSLHGLWLESELPLEPGAELVVSLAPPRWRDDQPFVALAEVARVGLFRRQHEARPSGMGLCFLDFERGHEQRLREALRGLPPPLPRQRSLRPPPLPARVEPAPAVLRVSPHPSIEEIGRLPQITLADGSTFSLRAEAQLLTAGRGARSWQLASQSTREPVRSASLVRLGSPMSAILDQREPRRLRVAS